MYNRSTCNAWLHVLLPYRGVDVPAENTPRWRDVKQRLAGLDQEEMIALVKELFDRSKENRAFLSLRLLGQPGGEALESYRKQVSEAAYPKSIHKSAHIPTARKLIHTYSQGTTDVAGTLELMMTCLEQGTAYTRQYGDIDAVFYTSLGTVLSEMVKLFETPEGEKLYPHFEERLLTLRERACDIGWGYGDYVIDLLGGLEIAIRYSDDEDE